ncbi:MAG: DUF4832 domain-containing protein [Verrucomicrobia bacterium]|nr:DUF4832 domain-containing protein [Verrucomicrobiota bacterium]
MTNGAVQLQGVGPDNPLIYDNDWWFDVFDNNYLWAQASLGKINLRGNIVSRDMWDWDKGYLYPMQKCVDDAHKALKLAHDSGLRNIPDITPGADKVLRPPVSGKIEDTVPDDSPGCQLIIAEARRATPEKPLLIVSGGPLTTVANALLLAPDIAPNLVVFNILVSHYGYNGKDGWAAYIVAKKTRYVDWGGRSFWDKNSVFTAKDFEGLPKNPFCDDMRRLIQSNLGQVNQLGDGAPLVWLFEPRCWTRAVVYLANWRGKAVEFQPAREGESGDVLVIPKAGTDLRASREEFFRVLENPAVYQVARQTDARPGQRHDLTPFHDAERALANPHKGWYHHYPDNHINKYEIARDADLREFPGMDHLYLRLAWGYLEPREGQFDWAVIDRIIEKWTAHGLGIAFRISCKETSTDRVEQQFATPRWVMEAGAQGGHYRMGQATGSEGPWEPVFDDPIFLAKLERFLAAFAARYDQQPWIRYVDIGSIGDWGEGHSWAGSRKEVGFAARKRHVDLHLKHFKRAQLVVSDDFVFAVNDAAERAALHRYVLTNGITYRDDSILVNGYLAGTSDRFTVRSPGFFADAYSHTPTIFELEHYGTVKRLGNWEGRPDSQIAKYGKGRTGPDYFRGALELLRATYIGYHGYAHEWLADNPEFTRQMLNRCGYWLFPTSLALPEQAVTGTTIPITLTLENRGVAPPYQPYELRVKLSGAGTNWVRIMGQASKSWLPGTPVVCAYDLPLPAALPPGEYQVAIGLFDAAPSPARPVEFALQARLRDAAGYYRMATLKLTAPTPKD